MRAETLHRAHVLLIVIILSIHIVLASSQSQDNRLNVNESRELWNLLIKVYSKVEFLGSQGINVTSLVDNLNRALELIEKGDNESLIEAYNIITFVNTSCNHLMEELPDIVMWRNIRIYSTIGLLASLPILLYIFLPRIYLYVWYNSRKKWVVQENENR